MLYKVIEVVTFPREHNERGVPVSAQTYCLQTPEGIRQDQETNSGCADLLCGRAQPWVGAAEFVWRIPSVGWLCPSTAPLEQMPSPAASCTPSQGVELESALWGLLLAVSFILM